MNARRDIGSAGVGTKAGGRSLVRDGLTGPIGMKTHWLARLKAMRWLARLPTHWHLLFMPYRPLLRRLLLKLLLLLLRLQLLD